MRTDVKLGIVLGLGVLAVLAWYVVPSNTPQAIPLADAGGSGGAAAPTDKDDSVLPPPLFSPPADRTTSVSPPRADRRRPPGRSVAAATPKRTLPVTTAKATTRRATAPGADRARRTSSAPTHLARTEANRALSVSGVGASEERLPLVIPPGAKPPAGRTTGAADRVKPIPMPKPPPLRVKPPPKPKDRFHIVEQYDSFAILAEKYYGSQVLAEKLWKANPHVPDARRLKLGTKLRIPPLDELDHPSRPIGESGADLAGRTRPKPDAARARSAKPEPKEKFYIVKADDSFYAIARRVWGDGNRWRELHKLNRDVCRDPKSLRPGMKLRLTPPKPKRTDKKGGSARSATTKRSRPKSTPSRKPAE